MNKPVVRNVDILPLGDRALLLRFGSELDAEANRRAVAAAKHLQNDHIGGVLEVVPSLVSVLVRYDPMSIDPVRLSGELALRLRDGNDLPDAGEHVVSARFGGVDGPDLDGVAAELGMAVGDFISRHNATPLTVLATGFAPGFVYCGFHSAALTLARREAVRPMVPAGSLLFAAGQTAIAATDVPTGWHVIGRTDFRNFEPQRMPPTIMASGDRIRFVVA